MNLGKIIEQLPTTLCEKILNEILNEDKQEMIDEETKDIIQKFFENHLNISKTARQVFMHRNTLVYHLDKLNENIGLDIRKFEDAVMLKIALLILDYMKSLRGEE